MMPRAIWVPMERDMEVAADMARRSTRLRRCSSSRSAFLTAASASFCRRASSASSAL